MSNHTSGHAGAASTTWRPDAHLHARILEAEIGEDGRVRNTRLLRSIPLLDEAAIGAVRQWRFTPTLLNGEPVPVVMTVTVAFTLTR